MARTAGVDPALVSYYFGSKGDLFGAAVNLRVRASEEIAAAVSGDLRSAGPRLVRLSLTAWDDAAGGATFRTLLRRMATDVSSPEAIQSYATEQIATPMAEASTTSPARCVPGEPPGPRRSGYRQRDHPSQPGHHSQRATSPPDMRM